MNKVIIGVIVVAILGVGVFVLSGKEQDISNATTDIINTTEQSESASEFSNESAEVPLERSGGIMPGEERGSGEFKGDGSGRRAGEEKFAPRTD